jgi:GTP-binding protein
VVQLIDARHPPTEDDLSMLARLVESGRPFVVVFTKADKISRSERGRVARDFDEALAGLSAHTRALRGAGAEAGSYQAPRAVDIDALFFSAKTGEGKDELWSWILARIEEAGGA